MPRRDDVDSILVIGSGPIVIGQACEFDYSGTQACKALRREGYRVVLVNSNPATIMTDPEFADATYIEPLTPPSVLRVIERERPDALLPTLGGQTALNVAVALAESGALERHGVRLIGAGLEAIRRAEDRRLFVRTMHEAGLPLPRSGFAKSVEDSLDVARDVGYPVIVRPSFVLGGGGTGLAASREALRHVAAEGIAKSPIGEILVEESVEGWKEFELEVVRDGGDNALVVCSIENVDPMGVHTGDSITVAPAQTLTDREYQHMRDAGLACIRAIGVDTGGSNVQFAIHPRDGRMVLIEMNPRVSRSSALASKATGFPIAKIAALLAVGYRLDEIRNDITGETLAAFEPALDYVAVKVPRWAFEKFDGADSELGTMMRSVGEVMAIGRTFAEALGKAYRALERPEFALGADGIHGRDPALAEVATAPRRQPLSPIPAAEVAAAPRGQPPPNPALRRASPPRFPEAQRLEDERLSAFSRLRRRVGAWYEIIRPFSFTASTVPVAAAGALAAFNGRFRWPLFLAAFFGALLLHIGTNVVNEIYDVRKGVDTITSPRASHALLKGRLTEREAFTIALVAFAIATALGLWMILERGWPVVVLGVLGLLGGIGYTAPPLEYKFRALGLPLVFLLMGPLMVLGAYYVVTGTFDWRAVAISIPVGFLVTAILHGNEWRDIGDDARAGMATFSIRAGRRAAYVGYVSLVVGAYVALALAVAANALPPLSLLAMLSLPLLVRAIRSSDRGAAGQQRAIAMIDLQTAQLHALFGALLVLGVALAAATR